MLRGLVLWCEQRAEVVLCWTFVPPLTDRCGFRFECLGQGGGAGAAGSLLIVLFIFGFLRCGGWRGNWSVGLHGSGCVGSWRPMLHKGPQLGQRPRPFCVRTRPLARCGRPAGGIGEVVQLRLVAERRGEAPGQNQASAGGSLRLLLPPPLLL